MEARHHRHSPGQPHVDGAHSGDHLCVQHRASGRYLRCCMQRWRAGRGRATHARTDVSRAARWPRSHSLATTCTWQAARLFWAHPRRLHPTCGACPLTVRGAVYARWVRAPRLCPLLDLPGGTSAGLTSSASCTWTQLADMPVKRYGHVMVEFFQPLDSGLLGTDYLVVHGGIDENAIISSDVYAYVGGACCASRFALARAFVHIRYNSTSAKWAQHSSFGGPALMEHSALVYDGQMCVSSPHVASVRELTRTVCWCVCRMMFGGMNTSRGLSASVWAYNFGRVACSVPARRIRLVHSP